MEDEQEIPEGYEVVYTSYITLKNGKRLYAASYGRKAWRLVERKACLDVSLSAPYLASRSKGFC